MFSKIQICLFSVIIFLLVTGCEDSPVNPPVCTAEFVVINVRVTDTDGEAVENASINIIEASSGDTVQVCETYECAKGSMGYYTIFHDGLMNKVSSGGDTYTVSGTAAEGSFREDFVFAKNACHVFKKSGHDTVTIN